MKTSVISPEFRALMLEIWRTKYLAMARFGASLAVASKASYLAKNVLAASSAGSTEGATLTTTGAGVGAGAAASMTELLPPPQAARNAAKGMAESLKVCDIMMLTPIGLISLFEHCRAMSIGGYSNKIGAATVDQCILNTEDENRDAIFD